MRFAPRYLSVLLCVGAGACSDGRLASKKEAVAAVEQAVVQPPQSTPWLVVLCTPSDNTTPPAYASQNVYTNLFATAGMAGVFDYWNAESYGKVDLTGTVVTPWASALNTADGSPKTTAQISADAKTGNDVQNLLDCVNTQRSRPDFDTFFNYIGLYSIAVNAKDVGGVTIGSGCPNKPCRPLVGILLDIGSSPNFIEHEMGHGYTLGHSFNDTLVNCGGGNSGVYCDPYDIMSNTGHYYVGSLCINWPQDNHGCWTGPGLNLWNRYELGWIKNLVSTAGWPNSYAGTFSLAPRTHPESTLSLGLLVPAHQDSGYTVEFVTGESWDQGISNAPVLLVHRYYNNGNATPYLLSETGGVQVDFSHPFNEGVVTIALQGISQSSPPYATVRVSYSPNFASGYQSWWKSQFNGQYGNFVADVTGDGKADLVGLGNGYVGVVPSEPQGTATGTGFGAYTQPLNYTFNGQYGNFVVDVTGDGKADLVGLANGYVGVVPSTGTGFGTYNDWWHSTFNGYYGNFVGDVTGDGKADLVGLGNGGNFAYIGVVPAEPQGAATGTGFGTYAEWYRSANYSDFSGYYGTLLGDVNGDGKADLVVLNTGSITVLLSRGSVAEGGFTPPQTWWNNGFNGSAGNFLVDVTGDGKADLVGLGNGYIGVCVSTGTSFAYETWSNVSSSSQFGLRMADVTGDKLADVIAFNGSSVDVLPLIKAP